MAARAIALCGVLFFAAPDLGAQSNDTVFGSWRWEEDLRSPRQAGLGGAFVGLANDSASLLLNPAGLTLVPSIGELEIDLDNKHQQSAVPASVLFTFHKTRTAALGFYFTSVPERFEAPGGELNTESVSLGAAYAVPLGRGLRRFNFGVSLAGQWLYFDFDGSDARGVGDRITQRVTLRDTGRAHPVVNVGALWLPLAPFRVGLAWRWRPYHWQVRRTAWDPNTNQLLGEPSDFDLVAPTALIAGVSWEGSFSNTRVAGSVEGAMRFVPDTRDFFKTTRRGFQPQDYEITRGRHLTVGLELSRPFGKCTVQLRGGAGPSWPTAIRYQGPPNAEESAAFSAVGKATRVGLGLSIGLNTIVRGHVAYTRERTRTWLFAVALRYPGLFP